MIQAIIDNANGNNWMGFPFLFALAAAASIVIAFGVNVKKGRKDAIAFAQRRRPAGVVHAGEGAGVEGGDGSVSLSGSDAKTD